MQQSAESSKPKSSDTEQPNKSALSVVTRLAKAIAQRLFGRPSESDNRVPDHEDSAQKVRIEGLGPHQMTPDPREPAPPPPDQPHQAAESEKVTPPKREMEWVRSDDPIYYVYVHRDLADNVFYVGMGHDDWAWAPKSGLWKRYVDERSDGKFDVEIVYEDLYIDQAARKKDALLKKYAKSVINIQTPYRETDFKAWERFHALRNANRRFVADTKPLEGVDTEKAIDRYRRALEAMHVYANIKAEGGLVGEMQQGTTYTEVAILDRLTLCLSRVHRFSELIDECDRYFARYPRDRETAAGRTILKRADKARAKL